MNRAAGLLVSVRSPGEAIEALEGGASVVDIKEPSNGPLGRAEVAVWQSIRSALPANTCLSVALGELGEWPLDPGVFDGIAYRKLGLAHSGPDWAQRWQTTRECDPNGPRWIAVVYDDWRVAGAPEPDQVIDEALRINECAGVLVDTWNKSARTSLEANPVWKNRVRQIQDEGKLVALAGGLTLADLERLHPLHPDLFAVRTAACDGGNRLGQVTRHRVRILVNRLGELSNQTVSH